METKLIDRDGYRFTVIKLPVSNPAVEWATKFDMILTQDELDRVKAAL